MTDQAGREVSADACLRAAQGRVAAGEAALLLAHVLDRSRSWLYAHGEAPVPERDLARFEQLVARRAAGEPVAYLLGTRGFWRFDLAVTPDTLIPRPETELLVELALARIPEQAAARVADLGTGSGAIALAVAGERPQAQVVAVDLSLEALDVARGNAATLGIGNVEFRSGDWLAPLSGERFDLIASNPPYIAEGDVHLAQGDLRFEPRGALASGTDGLDAIRTIVAAAPAHLHDGGWLLVEHGWEQGAAVRALFAGAGFVDVATERDLEQRDRVTLGRHRLSR
ncbi:peptide chain release factor N(5)-glutamine methyltransferase [Luteimonas mephitis]|uniref:peptide chain release factor N(5)-glutamine methyltransferase n=1 Tax=Luteimonas mephitis TaxID=83615 RepID=UPI0004244E40|nr:peptide chain release factor N(5)-glutamine methyltransferase [Luteimonas mephitis]